jgi:branched-chain amino acid transport system permease protein
MQTLFGIPLSLLMSQVVIGLVNGMFYALLSMGLAIVFGMLNIINMAHGAMFMMGAYVAWLLLQWTGIGYWGALVLAPLIVGVFALAVERFLMRYIYDIDHIYGLLLTFGLAEVIEGMTRNVFGSSGRSYSAPQALSGATNLGFMILPNYRLWVIIVAAVVCVAVWLLIEKTPLGARLRAATENPAVVRSFGINVPLMISLTYAGGVALAAFAGVLAAPIYSVNPDMGEGFLVTVFAVVVIGGMGSIMGSAVTGIALGLVEGLTKIFYPQASGSVVFVLMVVVLLIRPAGLFGREA